MCCIAVIESSLLSSIITKSRIVLTIFKILKFESFKALNIVPFFTNTKEFQNHSLESKGPGSCPWLRHSSSQNSISEPNTISHKSHRALHHCDASLQVWLLFFFVALLFALSLVSQFRSHSSFVSENKREGGLKCYKNGSVDFYTRVLSSRYLLSFVTWNISRLIGTSTSGQPRSCLSAFAQNFFQTQGLPVPSSE